MGKTENKSQSKTDKSEVELVKANCNGRKSSGIKIDADIFVGGKGRQGGAGVSLGGDAAVRSTGKASVRGSEDCGAGARCKGIAGWEHFHGIEYVRERARSAGLGLKGEGELEAFLRGFVFPLYKARREKGLSWERFLVRMKDRPGGMADAMMLTGLVGRAVRAFEASKERQRKGRLDKVALEPFTFRFPGDAESEIKEVWTLEEFFLFLKEAPVSSLEFHAWNDDFSDWLEELGEKMLAKKVKGLRGSGEALRESLLFNLMFDVDKLTVQGKRERGVFCMEKSERAKRVGELKEKLKELSVRVEAAGVSRREQAMFNKEIEYVKGQIRELRAAKVG